MGQSYIRNAIIKDVNSVDPNDPNKELKIRNANWSNVTFENSNLSKMSVTGMEAHSATLEFKDTTLPFNMHRTNIRNLILNNITFPKQEIIEDIKKDENGSIADITVMVPSVINLEIYGTIKNSLLESLSSDKLETLKGETEIDMPTNYKGPKDIYDRLKTSIYKGESKKTEFGNFTSSLNKKPQSPVLLALLQGKADHTRG